MSNEISVSESGCRRRPASVCSGSLWLKRSQPNEREPMEMVSTGHQLGRTFTDSLQDPAAHKAAVIQEELQKVQVRAAELAAQREVVAQPRVQVLDQCA